MAEIAGGVLGQLVVVRVDVRAFSGKQVLRAGDLGAAAGSLPPHSLIALGNKKIVDPEALRPFAKLRQRAMRACFKVGTRIFGDAFAVPEAKAAALAAELAAIRHEWDTEVTTFTVDYNAKVAAWANSHQQWRDALLARAPSATTIAQRFGFDVVTFKVFADDATPGAADSLHREVGGLSDQLLEEIAVDARAAYSASFEKRTAVTRRALRPLKDILDKLRGLAFLSGAVVALADYVADTLQAIPASGPIEGPVFMRISTLMLWLSDAQNPRNQFFATAPGADQLENAASVPNVPEQHPSLPVEPEPKPEAVAETVAVEEPLNPSAPVFKEPELEPAESFVAPWTF